MRVCRDKDGADEQHNSTWRSRRSTPGSPTFCGSQGVRIFYALASVAVPLEDIRHASSMATASRLALRRDIHDGNSPRTEQGRLLKPAWRRRSAQNSHCHPEIGWRPPIAKSRTSMGRGRERTSDDRGRRRFPASSAAIANGIAVLNWGPGEIVMESSAMENPPASILDDAAERRAALWRRDDPEGLSLRVAAMGRATQAGRAISPAETWRPSSVPRLSSAKPVLRRKTFPSAG